jgi:Holliday junction DNA helicase RuvA
LFAHLEGRLAGKHPTAVVIDVGGVGYELLVPLSTFHGLPAPGEKVRLLTHFHVREDAQQMFGFLTEEDRSLFRLLLGVSGVGPKLALTILSGLSSAELARAVERQDPGILSAISGIGKKTAERVLLELKGKIPAEFIQKAGKGAALREEAAEGLADALLALISLGYKRANAQTAIQKVLAKNKDLSVEDLIRESLKII